MKSTMRSKKARRADALDRILNEHKWLNSKARRTGSMTEAEWQEMKKAEAEHLETMK